jgi:hypothetical protein
MCPILTNLHLFAFYGPVLLIQVTGALEVGKIDVVVAKELIEVVELLKEEKKERTRERQEDEDEGEDEDEDEDEEEGNRDDEDSGSGGSVSPVLVTSTRLYDQSRRRTAPVIGTAVGLTGAGGRSMEEAEGTGLVLAAKPKRRSLRTKSLDVAGVRAPAVEAISGSGNNEGSEDGSSGGGGAAGGGGGEKIIHYQVRVVFVRL